MSSVVRSQDEVAVTQQSPVGVYVLRIDDVLDFLDQVRQFVRPPLHALFEHMIKALTAIVLPRSIDVKNVTNLFAADVPNCTLL